MLKNLDGKSDLPWCVIGDFNDMMYIHEKRGGKEHLQNLLKRFTTTVHECGLQNLGFFGEKFTWEKSRGQHNWI